MEEYVTTFEFTNGFTKTVTIVESSFDLLHEKTRNNEAWFHYGREFIHLTNVCTISYELKSEIDKREQNKDASNKFFFIG